MCLPCTTDMDNSQQNGYSSDDSASLCSDKDYYNESDFKLTDIDKVEPTEISTIMRVSSIVDNYDPEKYVLVR